MWILEDTKIGIYLIDILLWLKNKNLTINNCCIMKKNMVKIQKDNQTKNLHSKQMSFRLSYGHIKRQHEALQVKLHSY